MSMILDGTGKGTLAEVSETNRLLAHAVGRTEDTEALLAGDQMNYNTDFITYTSDTESAAIYAKNNEEFDILLTFLGFSALASTNGVGSCISRVIRNPVAGTIVSTATPVSIESNLNFGSPKLLNVDVFNGFQGATATGGTTSGLATFPTNFTAAFSTQVVLTKNNTLVIALTPPPGNTSLDIATFIGLQKAPIII